MDLDDDINSPSRSYRRVRKLNPKPSKNKLETENEGSLAIFDSPAHELDSTKRTSMWLNDDDTMTFVREVTRPSTEAMRPMTAISQADMIPDLEDLEDEEGQAVKAPLVESNNLTSYQDLEKEVLKHTAFADFENIDMTPLFARLLPEEEVIEEDIPWTWDTLIASVSSHIPSKRLNEK
jgi:hypothetical protein